MNKPSAVQGLYRPVAWLGVIPEFALAVFERKSSQ